MSGSEPTARLTVTTPQRALELTVVDARYRQVAHGVGGLDVRLPPGLYELRKRAGPVIEHVRLALEPGQHLQQEEVRVRYPTAAPVSGSLEPSEAHQQAARAATRKTAPGAGAALVVLVLNVSGSDDAPLDEDRARRLTLVDRTGTEVAGADREVDEAGRWARFAWAAKPGGYALRVEPEPPEQQRPLLRPPRFYQSLWLSAGWQTIAFVPNSPTGPAPEVASVQMLPLEDEWDPASDEFASAIELALWGLRQGRCVIADDLLAILATSKGRNPMLGILAAHSLLLAAAPDLDLLDEVLAGAAGPLGEDHADVAGLRCLADELAQQRGAQRARASASSPSVDWPPMLSAAYEALVRRDAVDPGTIVDGSPAERLAPRLLRQGVWTSWVPDEPSAVEALRAPAAAADAATAPPPPEPDVPPLARRLRDQAFDDPAAARVATYVAELADLAGAATLDELPAARDARRAGYATGLPFASAQRALQTVESAVRDGP